MSKNGTVAYISTPKECDLCKTIGTQSEKDSPARAEYDLKTKMGPWANVCEGHRQSHAMFKELGLGRGQRLEVRSA